LGIKEKGHGKWEGEKGVIIIVRGGGMGYVRSLSELIFQSRLKDNNI